MAHTYSTDSAERRYVPFFIAIAAIAATFTVFHFLDRYQITVPWWATPPIDTMAFYGVFYELFDRWVWKCGPLHKLRIIRVPNLSGIWTGRVEPIETNGVSAGLGVKADLSIQIRQTWTTMLIIGDAALSQSHSLSANLLTSGECTLSYEYLNEPRPSAPSTMHAHRGVARVMVLGNCARLDGEYYSGRDRQNIGTIHLRRSQREG
ncbi:MAG TPA: hypothetical protein VFI95_12395 [Terriglobales bacterium]|nr:hypothetical protein [Terriglobales bacterium]